MAHAEGEGDCSFCDIEWVHVFERDTAAGAVFAPSGTDVPLSRRPRERLMLRRDGSAVIRVGQADDRLGDRTAQWTKEDDEIVVRSPDGATWRIVEYSRDRLLVLMN